MMLGAVVNTLLLLLLPPLPIAACALAPPLASVVAAVSVLVCSSVAYAAAEDEIDAVALANAEAARVAFVETDVSRLAVVLVVALTGACSRVLAVLRSVVPRL